MSEASTHGIHCPICAVDSTDVVDSRPTRDGMRRRTHVCANGHRFATMETSAVTLDGNRYVLSTAACTSCAALRERMAKARQTLTEA